MRNVSLYVALILSLGGAHIARATPTVTGDPPGADISAFKDKLVVWTDGKGHYVAMVLTPHEPPYFWSRDGKKFYALRTISGGSEGGDEDLKRLDRTFWDPRQRSSEGDASWTKESGKLVVECGDRKTTFDKTPDGKKIVDGAKFFQQLWPRKAYALVRDTSGRYYYVDTLRTPENSKAFRLFVGPKGAMKLAKMTNVVSDSEGDVFSTASGDLRLILGKKDSSWIAGGGTPRKLLWVPIEDNIAMIYDDLGVYTGERFGTPCDEL